MTMGPPKQTRNPDFCRYLISIRESQGLSQMQVGRMAGLDHSLISRYESGDRTPYRPSLTAICDALNLASIERIRLFALADMWPWDDVPTLYEADRLTQVLGAV